RSNLSLALDESIVALKIQVGKRILKPGSEMFSTPPTSTEEGRITGIEIKTSERNVLYTPKPDRFLIKTIEEKVYTPILGHEYLEGFWGRTLKSDDSSDGEFTRLGPIWGRSSL